MGKTMSKVDDGPLEGEVFALDSFEDGSRFSFTLNDGRVAVYRTFIDDKFDDNCRHLLVFVGIDPPSHRRVVAAGRVALVVRHQDRHHVGDCCSSQRPSLAL